MKQSPNLGFTLILQLTGVNGSHQFDRLTKTKTVETILTSMDVDGIQTYIDYLLQQVNDKNGSNALVYSQITLEASSMNLILSLLATTTYRRSTQDVYG